MSRDAFYDRTVELARLLEVPERLAEPSWLAILGQRKGVNKELLARS